MKKQITIALFIAILIGVYQTGCADGQGEQEGSGTKTTIQTTKFEDAQGDCTNGGVKIEVLVDGTVDGTQTQYLCNGAQGLAGSSTKLQATPFEDAQGDCTNGGVKIEVLVDGTVDDTQTQYICNGINGQVEQSGTNTSIQTTKFEDAQGDCTNGGVKIEVLVDGTVDDTQTQYLCNGAQGLAGSSTNIQATPFEDAQGDCTNGGVKIEVLVDGTVDDTQTQYICHGVDGHDGKDGQNSYQALVITSNDVGTNCAHGGIRIDSGVDTNNNNTLESTEIVSTRYICNGANGADGQNGLDGTNGTNGTNASIQTTPFDGAQGSCTNGGVKVEVLVDGVVQTGQTQYLCNGANGADGQDGQNGADGQNGHNALVITSNENAGTNCAHGGIRIDSGVDKNNNNTLESTEIVSTRYICNGANGADGQNGQDGTNGTNGTIASIQTTPFVGAQGSCANGGVKVEVLMNGVVQAGQTQYICNGKNGANGTNGTNGTNASIRTTSFSGTQGSCNNGGVKVEVLVDGVVQTGQTQYICNGANGSNGANGTNGTNGTNASIQTTPFVGAQGGCTHGGVKVEVLVDGVVQAGQTQYLCNGVNGADGQDGQNGADGQNGHNALVATSNENAGANCANGGIRIDSGVDKNNNNTLESTEIVSTRYVCNGVNGADGQNGQDGTNGTNASIQTTTFVGAQGSCTHGGVKIEVLMDGVVQAGQTQYICNGADSSGVCLTDNDCRETAYCDQTTLMCVDKKASVESCTQANQCLSGYCVYNVCLKTGDSISFGHYEQDNDTTNGKEPIEWRILAFKGEDQILVISKKILDAKPYHKTASNIYWEKSTIRSWLNGYTAAYNSAGENFNSDNFIDAAFTVEEKVKIIASNVPPANS